MSSVYGADQRSAVVLFKKLNIETKVNIGLVRFQGGCVDIRARAQRTCPETSGRMGTSDSRFVVANKARWIERDRRASATAIDRVANYSSV